MNRRLLAGISLLVLALPNSLFACCMTPAWYEGEISQKKHEALVLHHDGREELVLRIDVGLTKEERMPDRVAWVVTVPSVPDGYDASIAPAVFDDVGELLKKYSMPPPDHMGEARSLSDVRKFESLDIDVFQVGPYEIHEIKTVGRGAVVALNEWLGANGFPQEDVDHMKWFVDRGMTWLCIQISSQDGAVAFDERTDLPPLRVSFATPRPYYPLKFSSRQGVFPLRLDLLTGAPIDFGGSDAVLQQLSPDPIHASRATWKRNVELDQLEGEHLLSFLGVLQEESRFEAPSRWYLNRVISPAVNTSRNPISAWKSDVFLPLESN